MTPAAELTAELLVDRLAPNEIRVSPDGRLVAFVAAPIGKRSEHRESAIWIAPTDGAEPARKLTAGSAEDKTPRWAPGSDALYFLSDRRERGEFQLYRLLLAGGEAQRLTEGKPGIGAYAPVADGRTVALLASDAPTEEDERRERDRDDAQVFGEDWRPQRVRILDVGSREVRTLAAPGDRHVVHAVPSPDGSLVAVVLWETPEIDNWAREATVALVDPGADRIADSWRLPSGGVDLAWRGDGAALVVLAEVEPGGQSGFGLFLLEREPAPREPTLLTSELRACPLTLAPADEPLVSVAAGLDSTVARVRGTELLPLADLPGSLSSLSSSADGRVVAVVRGGPDEPYDVWAARPEGGDWTRISDLNPELRRVRFARRERLSWTARDGLELDGVLLLPPGTNDGGRFPLVVLVHGGPYGRFADDLQLIWASPGEWLAAAGYAVFLPNPRGGLGHGLEFASLVRGAVGVDDWQDIVDGLDVLVARDDVDGERLAIGGWSQGGFMSAWAITQTHRFRAAVMGAGVSDWGMMVAESDSPTFEATLGGSTGWEGPGRHRHDELSPISYVAGVRTPTLILHGERDERVPASQGRFFARALRAHDVPFELVIYPREPHGLGERNHILDVLRRWRSWLDRWLQPLDDEPAGTSAQARSAAARGGAAGSGRAAVG